MAQPIKNLDKKQKLALAGLAVFGILLIGFWVYKLDSEIKGPLAYKPAADNSASATAQDAAAAEEAKLKSQDTDGDGLSDWDELNIYHTSPYLADSDSDGIPDGVEVKNGTDPNCPQGKVCNAPLPVATSSNLSVPAALPIVSTASSSADLNSLLLSGQIDAASLRQLLINSGVSKADLDKISDADLLKAYQTQLASSSKKQ
ncbi:MAG: hypothetical protein PHO56_05365 [Patescibacteria group bacterium]|nr:hypothetical protein [Patescibacteria group bacterium]